MMTKQEIMIRYNFESLDEAIEYWGTQIEYWGAQRDKSAESLKFCEKLIKVLQA